MMPSVEQVRELIRFRKWEAAEEGIATLRLGPGVTSQADAEWLCAALAYQQERYDDAFSLCQKAARLYQEQRHRSGEARAFRTQAEILRGLNRNEEALRCAQHAVALSYETGERAIEAEALDTIAMILYATGYSESALDAVQHALDLYGDTADRVGRAGALCTRSEVLRTLDRHEESLDDAEQALAVFRSLDHPVGPAIAHRLKASALSMLGRYDDAVREAAKSRDLCVAHGYALGEANALFSMALGLEGAGQLNEALSCAEQAIRCYDTRAALSGRANSRLVAGRLLRSMHEPAKALDHLRQAEGLYQRMGDRGRSALASSLVSQTVGLIGGVVREFEQVAVDTLFSRVTDDVATILGAIGQHEREREAFLTARCATCRDALVFAREWNSWHPLAPGEERARGGGYLLRWAGRSIAVDPGPGFLANLRDCGFGLADIDAILVTHNHLDHVAELPHILTLVHEHNQLLPAAARKIDLFLSPSALQAYVGMVVTSPDVGQLVRLLPGVPLVPPGYQIEIVPCHAEHGELGDARHALSVAVTLLSPESPGGSCGTVGFTGDTAWSMGRPLELVQRWRGLPRPRLLVAHLGSVYPTDGEAFHPNHLGYRGVAALARTLSEQGASPDLLVVSEFGIECKPCLQKILEMLRVSLKDQRICAGTLGRVVLLPQMQVACDYGGLGAANTCSQPSVWSGRSEDLTREIFRCDGHRTDSAAASRGGS